MSLILLSNITASSVVTVMTIAGVQHYRDSYNKDLTQQQSRDILRRSECSKAGITLIEIPYWWDESERIPILCNHSSPFKKDFWPLFCKQGLIYYQ